MAFSVPAGAEALLGEAVACASLALSGAGDSLEADEPGAAQRRLEESQLATAAEGEAEQELSRALVRVCVRVRPLLPAEVAMGATTLRLGYDPRWVVIRPSSLAQTSSQAAAAQGGSSAATPTGTIGSTGDEKRPRAFEFHRVFGPEASQEDVFANAGLGGLLDRVVSGFHATVLAYGQSGSGKTHTMEGFEHSASHAKRRLPEVQVRAEPERLGLVPRALEGLFDRVVRCRASTSDDIVVRVSFLQLYNERIFDLLNPVHAAMFQGGAKNASDFAGQGLRLRWNPGQASAVVENLFVFECRSAAEVTKHYEAGIRSRVVASHKMNDVSSRSHCVLTLTVERSSSAGLAPGVRTAKLTLVDLAGSERQGLTGAVGQTFKESASINQSLFVLRKVIVALARAQQRRGFDRQQEVVPIPYRESRLTTLLRDAIGGSSFTTVVACISPNDAHIGETVSTLHYAATAGRVSNRPAVNLDPKSALIQELQTQVRSLRRQLEAARAHIVRITGQLLPLELSGVAPLPLDSSAPDALIGGGDGSGIADNGSLKMSSQQRRPGLAQLQPLQVHMRAQPSEALPSQALPLQALPPHPPRMASSPASSVCRFATPPSPLQALPPLHLASALGVDTDQENSAGCGAASAPGLPQALLAAKLVEAVAALRGTAADNEALRASQENLELENERLRLRVGCLERESVEAAATQGELQGALGLTYDSKGELSGAASLDAYQSSLFLDVIGLRRELDDISQKHYAQRRAAASTVADVSAAAASQPSTLPLAPKAPSAAPARRGVVGGGYGAYAGGGGGGGSYGGGGGGGARVRRSSRT